MNKTVNINLAGIFFHIDEDAYLKLSRYLEAIKRSFTDSQGRSEIIADIEARIAELFSERIQNDRQVVGLKLVDEVIAIMGQPEDYLVDDEIFEDEPSSQYNQKSSSTRRLFRDTDNSYVGGVSAGLGHYFGIDPLWIRLVWFFLIFGAGTGFLLYILLWALIPEAKTTAEKLTMTGDPVTISNIEKKIKDGIDTVSETVKNVDLKKHGDKLKEGFDTVSDTVKGVDFQKQGNRIKSGSQDFFESIGSLIMFFLKVIAKFIGIILIIVGITTLIGLIIAYFTIGITNAVHFPPMNFLDVANAANIPMWLMSTLVFFAFSIPFFFVFYLGLKILVNNLKSIGKIAKFTLLGLWLMSIIGIIIIGIKQATEYTFDAEVIAENELNIKANDTLKIQMTGMNRYKNYYFNNGNDFKLIEDDNGQSIVSSNVKLMVFSTTDSLAKITIEKEASGSSYELAKKRASAIDYNFNTTQNTLELDAFHITDAKNKFSDQEVRVTVYLPEGAILYTDKNTKRFQRKYYNSLNNILSKTETNHYFKIMNNKVECLDCEEAIEKSDDTSKLSNDTINTTIDKPEVSIKINGEDGVNIEVNDN